jgi:sensor histidine kinase YesM
VQLKVAICEDDVLLCKEAENAYESIKQDNDRNFLTTKSGQGHGYGLKNIAKCVEKYNGSCRIL